MTDLQEKILIWIVIGLAGTALSLLVYDVSMHFLNYEGYFCQPVEYYNNVQMANEYCGHGWNIMKNSTGSYWQIKGWAFGDFP